MRECCVKILRFYCAFDLYSLSFILWFPMLITCKLHSLLLKDGTAALVHVSYGGVKSIMATETSLQRSRPLHCLSVWLYTPSTYIRAKMWWNKWSSGLCIFDETVLPVSKSWFDLDQMNIFSKDVDSINWLWIFTRDYLMWHTDHSNWYEPPGGAVMWS